MQAPGPPECHRRLLTLWSFLGLFLPSVALVIEGADPLSPQPSWEVQGRVGSTTAPELWDKKPQTRETYRKLADLPCVELFKPDARMPSCPRYLTHTDPFLAQQEASVSCTLSHFQQKP